jgi:hypothetical protein
MSLEGWWWGGKLPISKRSAGLASEETFLPQHNALHDTFSEVSALVYQSVSKKTPRAF